MRATDYDRRTNPAGLFRLIGEGLIGEFVPQLAARAMKRASKGSARRNPEAKRPNPAVVEGAGASTTRYHHPTRDTRRGEHAPGSSRRSAGAGAWTRLACGVAADACPSAAPKHSTRVVK